MTCWNCERAAGEGAICAHCGKLQPLPRGADPFSVMGFARRFDLDREAVDGRFRELSRKVHPDKFGRATPEERRFAMQWTTALNDAYRVLRDDVRRGEFLVAERGIDLSAQARGNGTSDLLSPGFLAETLDRREALCDARIAGDAAREAELVEGARLEREAVLREASDRLRAWDNGASFGAARDEKAVAMLFAKARVLARFIREDDE